MLDFYLSNTSNLEFPIESDYVGSISMKEFELIAVLVDFAKSLGIKFTWHSDFYIDPSHLNELVKFIAESENDEQNDVLRLAQKSFKSIIESAITLKCGIYCFCD